MNKYTKVLIVGVGNGLSSSLAKLLYNEGMSISLAARNVEKLINLKKEVNANVFKCDASLPNDVENLFIELDKIDEEPNFVIYNPSARGSEERLRFNTERFDHWVGQGAQVSDRVKVLHEEADAIP